jgi:hypothetical protein
MKLSIGLMLGALLIGNATAQKVDPDVLTKSVTNEVLNIVSKDQDFQNCNTAKA